MTKTGPTLTLFSRYSRILARLFDHASDSERRGSRTLLSWLVCAKRTLTWAEIQGAKSINIDDQLVDFQGRSFRVDSKDLCGSLVEIRSDGTVELVHLTAKRQGLLLFHPWC